MENKLVIRKAEISDLNAIISLRTELLEYECSLLENDEFNISWIGSEKGREDTKYFILDDNALTFIVYMDDLPIGFICGELEKKKSWERIGYFYLTNLFVKEEYRGKGIGYLLLDNFKNEVFNKFWGKVQRIKLSCSYNNKDSISFYEEFGFKKNVIELIMDV